MYSYYNLALQLVWSTSCISLWVYYCIYINSFRSFEIIITVKYKFCGNFLINVTLPVLHTSLNFYISYRYGFPACVWLKNHKKKGSILGGKSIPIHKNKSPCRIRAPDLQVSRLNICIRIAQSETDTKSWRHKQFHNGLKLSVMKGKSRGSFTIVYTIFFTYQIIFIVEYWPL